MLETEPVRRLPGTGEPPTGILAAADVLANVPERTMLAWWHDFAGACRFVAHS